QNRVTDTALVQDKNNKNILTVYRGDILSGRFRVTSISEKELVLTDTSLKIKHTIAMSENDRTVAQATTTIYTVCDLSPRRRTRELFRSRRDDRRVVTRSWHCWR